MRLVLLLWRAAGMAVDAAMTAIGAFAVYLNRRTLCQNGFQQSGTFDCCSCPGEYPITLSTELCSWVERGDTRSMCSITADTIYSLRRNSFLASLIPSRPRHTTYKQHQSMQATSRLRPANSKTQAIASSNLASQSCNTACQ